MPDSDQTDRRQFLQKSILGGLVITSTSEVTAETEQGVKETEVTQDIDVLVVGGGTAGNIAAIQGWARGSENFNSGKGSTVGWNDHNGRGRLSWSF
jgi:hypothetical protein